VIEEGSYGKFKYLLYKPDHLEDLTNLPLIVVMHGSGEIGSSLSKLKKREPYISLKNGKFKTDAFVLMPQLPKNTWGKMAADMMKLIGHFVEELGCDKERVYLTGHSLGVMGVIEIMLKYPGYFAAGASLSAAKNYKADLPKLSHIPLYFLYGEKEHNYKKYAKEMFAVMYGLNTESKLVGVSGYGHPIQFTWCSEKYGIFDWLMQYRTGDLKNPTWQELLSGLGVMGLGERVPDSITLPLKIKKKKS